MLARVLVGLLVATSLQGATIRGTVVDPGDAEIAKAKIRLLVKESRTTQLRTQTRDDGSFELNDIGPGSYLVAITFPGFREQLVRIDVADRAIQLGRVMLGLAGCDSPGTNCDYMCSGDANCVFPTPPKAKQMTVRADCAVDADAPEMYCGTRSTANKRTDFRILATQAGVWIEALNGARLAEPQGVRGDCGEPSPKVRIDGLGFGTQYCLSTNGGRKSRLYLVEEVSQHTDTVPVHVVTQP